MKYVYVMRCGTDHYKVGVAKYVISRLQALQTSNPVKIEIVATRLVGDPLVIEAKMHKYLSEHRLEGGREWFKLTPEQALELLVIINQEPELVAMYNILEMNKLLKKLVADKEETDRKLERLDNYVRRKQEAREVKKEAQETTKTPARVIEPIDTLAQKALEIFKEEGRASTSLLQRRLSIGYARAARVMDKLEEDGELPKGDGIRARILL